MSTQMTCRAKLKDTDKWIYGYYAAKQSTRYCFKEDYERFPVETEHYIIQDQTTDWGLPNELRPYKVLGNTVCRNTGEFDREKNEIFENDIVTKNVHGIEYVGVVKFKDGAFGVEMNKDGSGQFLCFCNDICTIIGNIIDNPELLEVIK